MVGVEGPQGREVGDSGLYCAANLADGSVPCVVSLARGPACWFAPEGDHPGAGIAPAGHVPRACVGPGGRSASGASSRPEALMGALDQTLRSVPTWSIEE